MAPLNFYGTSRAHSLRTVPGSLLPPCLAILLCLLAFFVAGETAQALSPGNGTSSAHFRSDRPVLSGQMKPSCAYGATGTNGNSCPAGPIGSEHSFFNNPQESAALQPALRQ